MQVSVQPPHVAVDGWVGWLAKRRSTASKTSHPSWVDKLELGHDGGILQSSHFAPSHDRGDRAPVSLRTDYVQIKRLKLERDQYLLRLCGPPTSRASYRYLKRFDCRIRLRLNSGCFLDTYSQSCMHDTIFRIVRRAQRKRIFTFCTAPAVSAGHTKHRRAVPFGFGFLASWQLYNIEKHPFCHVSRDTAGQQLAHGAPWGTCNATVSGTVQWDFRAR